MTNVFTVFNNLPIELIYIILSYTYEPQSTLLTSDIQNYYKTKPIVEALYFDRYVVDFGEAEPSNKDWLINDLFRYANRRAPTINGYVESFYQMFFKYLLLTTPEQVNQMVKTIEGKPLVTQINMFWGLFTPEERNDFLINNFPNNIIL
jgi:hypothetical protein